jgi:hypothetical protein
MITGKQFVDSLTRAQLIDLAAYIAVRIERLETAEFMTGVLHDQRVHPQQHNPLVEGSYEGIERAHRIAEAKAEERRQAAAERRGQRTQ